VSKPSPTGLRFYEKTHRYTLGGKPIPGVTTLIGGGVPKPALPYWAAKTVAEYVVGNRDEVVSLIDSSEKPWEAVNYLKGIPWKKRDEAAVRGSEVHALAELIIHGHEAEVPDALLDVVNGYVRFLEAFDVEPILTEIPVANRTWHYAGKPDAIVKMGRGPWAGEIALLDWKSSKSVYGDTALQCAAYARAEFGQVGEDEIELPEIARIGVVHVTPAGSDLYDLGDIDKAFKEFLSAAYIAKTADRRKSLITEPITPEEAA
jgi:hypothetical protein